VPRHSILQDKPIRKIWDAVTGHYPDIHFQPKYFDVTAVAEADIKHAPDDPLQVSVCERMEVSYNELCRQCTEAVDCIGEEDLADFLGFALVHEVGHHRLGHTEPEFRCITEEKKAACQREADEWAMREHRKLVESGVLPEVPEEKLSAFVTIAQRAGANTAERPCR